MNRQQKKCLIATVGFHLLLILILVVGPGFFSPKPKPDTTQLLDVIPATAVEAALNSGVKSAQPPPPAPPVIQPPSSGGSAAETPPPNPGPETGYTRLPTFVEKKWRRFSSPNPGSP